MFRQGNSQPLRWAGREKERGDHASTISSILAQPYADMAKSMELLLRRPRYDLAIAHMHACIV